MDSWESIRANWVNGNLSDTRKQIMQLSKKQLIGVIYNALSNDYQLSEPHTTSGDLIDLREILRSIIIKGE